MQDQFDELNLRRERAEQRIAKGAKYTTLEAQRLEQQRTDDESRVFAGVLSRAKRALLRMIGRGNPNPPSNPA
jgi:hypothetical protein